MGIQNGATPKVMLRNMRNNFDSTVQQNITHEKILNLTEHIENTPQMQQEIQRILSYHFGQHHPELNSMECNLLYH